ncbi:hypothetical protein DAPPUDRAFT_307621 [Daphnia pulex]|uniref:Uncharacterized protein n=1 Tax=Daphnia pulex TaxID=6669 RepID=E9HY16_DAPPU|nr:hypothetical protein DAPPUDRAFT_307621 [Daphnia pulex]|eukprot:EFX63365.1 hypothetical protein DAPPUDRAFT_307621 [Daphnia pulex]
MSRPIPLNLLVLVLVVLALAVAAPLRQRRQLDPAMGGALTGYGIAKPFSIDYGIDSISNEIFLFCKWNQQEIYATDTATTMMALEEHIEYE